MEAARVAALRGHRVTLYEKNGALGGQLRIAGKPESKRKILWLHDYLAAQLKKLGVSIRLGVTVTPQMVQEVKPDAVVVATGAKPVLPDLPGIGREKVMGAWELLRGEAKVEGQKVVVLGGGLAGCEAAEYLLGGKNRVTIVEQLPSAAGDMEPYNRFGILELFREREVALLTRRRAMEVTESGVRVINEESGQEEFLEADQIVFALGARPVNELVSSLEGKVPQLFTAGDCNQPRVILEAVYEGSLAGRQIE